MKHSYQVVVDKKTGVPCANVAHGDTWDLVEYLSYQRTVVFYTHCEEHLTVRFPHLSAARAQQLLNEWTHARNYEHQASPAAFAQST